MEEERDLQWQAGNNAAWERMLGECLQHLPQGTQEQWRLERAATVALLRELCAEFGDNNWTDDLYLADVIEKHLAKHLWV